MRCGAFWLFRLSRARRPRYIFVALATFGEVRHLMRQIAAFQWQLSVYFDDGNAIVDGVRLYQPHRTGSCGYGFDHVGVGVDPANGVFVLEKKSLALR